MISRTTEIAPERLRRMWENSNVFVLVKARRYASAALALGLLLEAASAADREPRFRSSSPISS